MRSPSRVIMAGAAILIASMSVWTQKTVMLDHEGKVLTDNEFVDIRMANFQYPDATIVTKQADGTTELRLQKIPQEGMAAPDFAVKTLDGKKINAADLEGKVIVLNFWFIGCPACIREDPKLNELRAKFAGRDNIVFVAMTADAAHDVKKYRADHRSDYIQAADAGGSLKSFTVSNYPKNIVIGGDGVIRYWRSPIHAWDKFESVINAELAKH